MKKTKTIALLIAFAAIVAYIGSASCGNNTGGNKTNVAVADSGQVKTPLSPVLPFDVTLPPKGTGVLETTIRRSFDIFSWDSFIAICWPAQGHGVIGQFGDNPTVWETWKKNYEVFLDNGLPPSPWDIALQSKEANLSQTGKTPANMTAIF